MKRVSTMVIAWMLLASVAVAQYPPRTEAEATAKQAEAQAQQCKAYDAETEYAQLVEDFNLALETTTADASDIADAIQKMVDAAGYHTSAQAKFNSASNTNMPTADVFYNAGDWAGAWWWYQLGWTDYHFAWHDYQHGAIPLVEEAIELVATEEEP